ncbi:hypothetical protein ACIGCZ_00890 [Streptomyces nigra]|uniref:hypothetical protein n=1 Tax=Streptomyces nigra TaxID=1827580 RepID=UPI0037D7E78B
MPATKAPPAKTRTAEPVLENFYTVSEAAIRLRLREPGEPGKKGEKFLRDGVNQQGWPCHRMAGQLLFSDSDLAVIAEKNRNRVDGRSRPRRTRRPRKAAAAGQVPAQRTA